MCLLVFVGTWVSWNLAGCVGNFAVCAPDDVVLLLLHIGQVSFLVLCVDKRLFISVVFFRPASMCYKL